MIGRKIRFEEPSRSARVTEQQSTPGPLAASRLSKVKFSPSSGHDPLRIERG